ncbi:MAG: heavy metal translocating P-type ATPase [Lachnospiraceae bacterium]|nr:heavy metal translocating P-type ATPase [Lachnospiraceae bacterium]
MKCKIKHESKGRLRVHLCQCYMSIKEADMLEAYLNSVDEVKEAKVYERTCDAVILYDHKKNDGARDRIIKAFSEFDHQTCDVAVPKHSSRALSHEYLNKITARILIRSVRRLIVPINFRRVFACFRAIPFIRRGIRSLMRGRLEVSVLDAASIVVSLLRGDHGTASSVMFLLGIGDIMEEWTHKKSIADLADAMSLNVDKVWLLTKDKKEVLVGVNEVRTGDIIIVRTGNMIPLDGEVWDKDAMVNQASITGEPLPVHKKKGGFIYAGSVIEEGELYIKVHAESGSGRYDRIVKMIEESEKLKSSAEDKASHLADKLVPWTFGITALTYLFTRNAARAASILNVDFSCALKLSMPVAVLSAMREAGKNNISVKGGKFMEAFSEADTIVFDKTGTLTDAKPVVKDVIPFGGNDPEEMLRLAACLEEHYPHSIANAVVEEAKIRKLDHEEKHSQVNYVVAHGIASSIDGKKVCIGSYHFIFEDEGAKVLKKDMKKLEDLPNEYSHLYLAIGGKLSAVILIEDPLKDNSCEVVKRLHESGFKKVVMMTGDSDRTAKAVAARVGVDEYYSEVLPEDKAAYISRMRKEGHKVIMVGDGVNDTPALSEADVGVAMNSGAAIAREVADVTITENDLTTLLVLRELSQKLMSRIKTNYRSIISFNSFLIFMGMMGMMGSSTTALLHNSSTIAISLKSMTNLLDDKENKRN